MTTITFYTMVGVLPTGGSMPNENVYWGGYSPTFPDYTGAYSGFPGQLINIAVAYSVPVSASPPLGFVTMLGDVTGPSNASVVGGLQTIPISLTAPTNGQALIYNGISWTPGNIAASGLTLAGDVVGPGSTTLVETISGLAGNLTLHANIQPTDITYSAGTTTKRFTTAYIKLGVTGGTNVGNTGSNLTLTPELGTNIAGNVTGGSVVASLQAPAGTGTEAALVVNRTGTNIISLHAPSSNYGTNQGGIWLGAGAVTPSDANVALNSDSVNNIYLNSTANLILQGSNMGTIQLKGTQNIAVTALQTSSYPVALGNYLIGIGTLTGPIIVTLPGSPNIGDTYLVKDVKGTCSNSNTITVVPSGGATIDGLTTYVIKTPYSCITVTYLSSNQWGVL